jgi:hypothetical protein
MIEKNNNEWLEGSRKQGENHHIQKYSAVVAYSIEGRLG